MKIDPASIGVGLYQHDVKAKHLRTSLDAVVESCVNYVAVDLNTASPALLRYVSGLNQLTARRVYDYRSEHGPFQHPRAAQRSARLRRSGVHSVGRFLKISGGSNPLDATWIHPESYDAGRPRARVDRLPGARPGGKRIGRARWPSGPRSTARRADRPSWTAAPLLLGDILAQLARPGRDPREDLPPPIFKKGVIKLDDLAPGMELSGTVLNVVDFGAFVDIGLHDTRPGPHQPVGQ